MTKHMKELEKIETDSDKLRILATWFDVKDLEVGNADNEVQKDLRRIADRLYQLESGLEELIKDNDARLELQALKDAVKELLEIETKHEAFDKLYEKRSDLYIKLKDLIK